MIDTPRLDALGGRGGISLEVKSLAFAYPDGTRALEGVDLGIGAGEVLAIVGQNGSGKSTLIRHFNGLLRASSGEVRVGGEPVGRRHVAELARLVGVAFQNPDSQIFAGRVAAEVAFGPRNAGLAGDELRERVAASLAAVGLDGHEDANPYDLGFSRRKLLSTAAMLATGAPAIVLDEPTTGLDAQGVATVTALVDTLRRLERTVVIVSHDMRFVAETVTRVAVMRGGRIALDAATEVAFAEEHWDTLRSTHLEPPLAARVGARLDLRSTPTVDRLVERLAGGSAEARG